MSTEHLMGEFGGVLDALMAPAEAPRQAAETYLRDLTIAQPGDVLLLLAQIGAQGVGGFQLDHRFLCLILLNRLAFRTLPGLYLNSTAGIPSSPFDVIPERTRGRIETVLCAGLKDEMNVRMRKGLGTCCAGWAEESSRRQRPVLPLPPVLIELTARKESFHRFTPYQVMTLFPTLLSDSMTSPLPAAQFAQILLAGLHDGSVDVQIEAFKAVEAVLSRGMTISERKEVGPVLVKEALTILERIPRDLLHLALQPLVDLAWDHTVLLRPSTDHLLRFMPALIAPPKFKDHAWTAYPLPQTAEDGGEEWLEYANPAQEILLAFANAYPSAVRDWDAGRLVQDLVPMFVGRLAAELVWEGEDQSDWLKEEDVEIGEYEASSPQDGIQRLAFSLADPAIFEAMLEQLKLAMSAEPSEWQVTCAGLMCFAAVLVESPSPIRDRLHEIITLIAKCASHPHFRVRYAFLHCIGEICHTARTAVTFGSELIDLCLTNLSDPIERVRAQATTTLTDIISTTPDTGPEPSPFNLRQIVEALCNAYNASQPFVKERILASLSDLETRVVGDVDFVRALAEFYHRILQQSGAPAMRKVVGRAIECSTVPMFVKAQYKHPELGQNLVKLAELLLRHQNDITTDDDPRSRYIIDGWMSFAKAIKSDFAPFLPFAVPHALKLASYNPARFAPRQQASSLTEDTPDVEEELDDWGDIPDLYDKAGAMTALATFGSECGKAMVGWVGEGMGLGVQGLGSPSRGVRSASCALIPSMLYVHKEGSIPIDVESLLVTLLSHTTRQEKDEDTDWDQLANHIKSFTDCIRVISIPLPPPILDAFLALLSRVVGSVAECMEVRRAMAEEEGVEDEEEEEREVWEWNALLTRVEEALEVVLELEKTVEGGMKRLEGMEERWRAVLEGLKRLKAALDARA
ncbi:armadillo-type protein [Dioszegia hungarica]|uniref:Armadillo-type protein n=1 Tax=Dioszegia hungarica TaxID=4972 RepID=A0AA38LX51_9TREE|nr:armadillo-type protein [Dioszegia hungarica]KAI9637514.1 armadillo-type protein [Dioszegia hungarica]